MNHSNWFCSNYIFRAIHSNEQQLRELLETPQVNNSNGQWHWTDNDVIDKNILKAHNINMNGPATRPPDDRSTAKHTKIWDKPWGQEHISTNIKQISIGVVVVLNTTHVKKLFRFTEPQWMWVIGAVWRTGSHCAHGLVVRLKGINCTVHNQLFSIDFRVPHTFKKSGPVWSEVKVIKFKQKYTGFQIVKKLSRKFNINNGENHS